MPEVFSVQEILCRLNERKREYDFPRASERSFWEGLPPQKREEMIARAGEELKAEIPMLKAADFMKYVRNGNRIDYETPYFRRRHMLNALVLGECAEYKGRFTDGIIELLWQILSEPVWCLPAHQRYSGSDLPGPEEWTVDLFAAETAKVLSDALQLVGAELEKICPAIVRRVRYEIGHRVLAVCERETFWWYEGTNNWSVWCCCSVNSAAIEVWQNDNERLARFLAKHIEPMKRFMDRYPADGGCNEGPSYWLVAVGMLMNGLDVLQRRLGCFDGWLNDPKLRKMVEFIPRMNLCGQWFMGFSDAESFFARVPRGLFVRYGRMTGSERMELLGVNLPETTEQLSAFGNRNVGSLVDAVANLTEDISPRGNTLFQSVDYWPDLQVWIARQKTTAPETGMVCTLKAGHNKQSHNHMDLGHFSLFYRNAPVIIDVGRGVYDRTCFSGARYTLWNLNSEGHNAARFDGMFQGLGQEYETALEVIGDEKIICDLSKAFVAENGVSSYVRTISFDREKGIIEIDEKAAFEGTKKIDIAFYTPIEPAAVTADSLELKGIRLGCENIALTSVVKVDWADAKINKIWGDLWQINLSCQKENTASWKIVFAEI